MSELDFLNLDQLQKQIGYKFKDKALLQQALTHKSTNRRSGDSSSDYERLEFLGDRVLGLLIAQMLLKNFPQESEGQVSRRFSALVNQETLAEIAGLMGLAEFIQVANMDIKAGELLNNPSILADVTEAILAAVYYDSGLSAAEKIVHKFWKPLMEERNKPPKDPKTALQEWAQAHNSPLPVYRIVERSGPDHSPLFTITIDLAGLPVLTAHGSSRRAAEQEAARKALRFLNQTLPE